LFDPVVMGQYTLSLWCEQAISTESVFTPQSPTKTRVCYQSYLSKFSNGISVPKVPKFTAVLYSGGADAHHRSAQKSTSSSTHTSPTVPLRREWRRFSAPANIITAQPSDPSLYVSPFAQSAYLSPFSHSSPAILTPVQTKSPVPSFVRDAPESYLWHVTIFKDGIQVDPRKDPELKSFSWANLPTTFTDAKFSKPEIASMCHDLSRLASKEEDTEGTLNDHPEATNDSNNTSLSSPAKNILSERADYLDLSSTHIVTHLHTIRRYSTDTIETMSSPQQILKHPIETENFEKTNAVTNTRSTAISDAGSLAPRRDPEISIADNNNYQNVIPTMMEAQSEFCLVGC